MKILRNCFGRIILLFVIIFLPERVCQAQHAAVANVFAKKVAEDILANGGNAFDAGVGALLTLTVAEPFSSGLGGGVIFLIYKNGNPQPILIDCRGKVPKNTSPDFYYREAGDFDYLTKKGDMAVCTPGFVAGCDFVLKNFGNWSWNDVSQYAIELAANGVPVDKTMRELTVRYYDDFIENSEAFNYFFPDWVPARVGESMVYSDLVSSLKKIAQQGAEFFSNGELAYQLTAEFETSKNQISPEDLQNFQGQSQSPLSIDFMGYKIFAPPLPSVGGAALLSLLKVIENAAADSLELNSGEEVELFVMAYQKAVSELGKFVLSAEDLSIRSQQQFLGEISRRKFDEITIERKYFAPFIFNEGQGAATVVVRDEMGNWLVANSSLNDYFGAKFIAKGTGILFNNFMANFAPLSGLENSIAPEKQPFTFLAPVMVFKDQIPVLAFGANGAERNVLSMARFIYHFCKSSLSPETLMKLPRFHYKTVKNEIILEARFSAPTLEYLKQKGFQLDFLRKFDISFGNFQIICRNPVSKQLESISDVRREGEIYVEF